MDIWKFWFQGGREKRGPEKSRKSQPGVINPPQVQNLIKILFYLRILLLTDDNAATFTTASLWFKFENGNFDHIIYSAGKLIIFHFSNSGFRTPKINWADPRVGEGVNETTLRPCTILNPLSGPYVDLICARKGKFPILIS